MPKASSSTVSPKVPPRKNPVLLICYILFSFSLTPNLISTHYCHGWPEYTPGQKRPCQKSLSSLSSLSGSVNHKFMPGMLGCKLTSNILPRMAVYALDEQKRPCKKSLSSLSSLLGSVNCKNMPGSYGSSVNSPGWSVIFQAGQKQRRENSLFSLSSTSGSVNPEK
jgi:hypothetical protein